MFSRSNRPPGDDRYEESFANLMRHCSSYGKTCEIKTANVEKTRSRSKQSNLSYGDETILT